MEHLQEVFLLSVLVCLVPRTWAVGYCDLKSCYGKQHTMCLYPSSTPSRACGKVESYGLTKSEADAILKKHNELRQYVASGRERRGNPGPQPAASNMRNLKWDDELATIAQRWANQCKNGHDTCRNVERYFVGQNIGLSYTSAGNDVNNLDLVQAWYDEAPHFDPKEVSSFTNYQDVGHYSQLVWATTETLGCGLIKFFKNRWNTTHLVCNYGPSGNYLGDKVYEIR